jgi:hypothetical protein
MAATSNEAEFNIGEVGRDYVFEIKAVDKDGLASDVASVTIFVPGASIEDVDYFILNEGEVLSGAEGSLGRVFMSPADGLIGSVTLNLAQVVSHGDLRGYTDVDIELYEWVGESTTTSPNIGMGKLLGRSSKIEFSSGFSGNYTWFFDSENQIVLDATKYYFIKIHAISTRGDLGLSWGLSSPPDSIDRVLYVIIKAVKNGAVIINDPVSNYVYQNLNDNFTAKYSQPFKNKYDRLVVDVKDFYTGELVKSQTIVLSDEQKNIGWHEISGSLNIDRPGYFKLNIYLSDLVGSEINFSIFGAIPKEGELLSQYGYTNSGIDENYFSGQVFRPVISGWTNGLTIMAIANGSNVYHGSNYWSIYEWNGNGNDLGGSRGNLLATTSQLCLSSNELVPMSWSFAGDGLYLDSNKYYFLSLNKETNGGQVPHLYMGMSDNGSLIDGRLVTPYVVGGIPGARYVDQGDLYLIINKKPESPSLPGSEN